MTPARRSAKNDGAEHVIDSLADAERSALEAVRKFLDTVNGAFPHTGNDGGSRQRIIDSAFRMAEELVGSSNEFAHRLVKVGGDVAKRAPVRKAVAKRTATRRATASKAPAKRSPAKKAPANKAAANKATARKAPAKKAAAG